MERIRTHWRLYTIGFLCVASLILWGAVYTNRVQGVATVTFLDVGEGDSTLIQSRSGIQVLIDGGRDRVVLGEIAKTLPLFDRSLDVVISAYPDKDNTGGLPFILEQYSVGKFIVPEGKTNSALGEAFRIAEEQKTEILSPYQGMNIDLQDGSYIKVLHAKESMLVLKYEFGEACFLFMGGATEKEETELISNSGDALNCDVLKIGRHGSKNATSESLLQVVAPTYAIFSNAIGNQYEYPHQEVIQRLEASSAQILNTMNEGRITFLSDGKTVVRK